MTEYQPSRTALGVAVLRAAHQLIDGSPKILDDQVILQLLDSAYLDHVQTNPDCYQMPQAVRLRVSVLIRSRYAEDRLQMAVKRGITQYVSLGAGFDTFPYRQPAWARTLRLFEVDQPASQAAKRERLAHSGISIPPNVEFVPIDFEKTSLADGLSASSFDATRPTFVSWLGVTMYLTQQAIDAVLRYVASLPRTSEIVFTFVPPPPADAPHPGHKRWRSGPLSRGNRGSPI